MAFTFSPLKCVFLKLLLVKVVYLNQIIKEKKFINLPGQPFYRYDESFKKKVSVIYAKVYSLNARPPVYIGSIGIV